MPSAPGLDRAAILHIVPRLHSLRDLELADEVSDADLSIIVAVKSLRSLKLSRAAVTDVGMKKLARLPELSELSLVDCKGLTDAGLEPIGRLKRLECLSLKGTNVTDTGLREVAKLRALKSLDLSGTNIDDAGLSGFTTLTSLERLTLNFTNIGDAGLKSLSRLATLRMIYVRSTLVTKNGVDRMRAERPRINVYDDRE